MKDEPGARYRHHMHRAGHDDEPSPVEQQVVGIVLGLVLFAALIWVCAGMPGLMWWAR